MSFQERKINNDNVTLQLHLKRKSLEMKEFPGYNFSTRTYFLSLKASPPNSTTVIHTNRCDQPKCSKPVDILERVAVENHVFHKSCFVCAICSSWLNHFNYCFVPDHDKFYCIQHYQDIENASCGLGEDIRHAIGIGPGVQQQFKFTPGVLNLHAMMLRFIILRYILRYMYYQ